jgi:pimeloyl-ACP methyl ester carboxylesterase
MTQKPTRNSRVQTSNSRRFKLSWLASMLHNKGWLVAGTAVAALGTAAVFNRAAARRAEANSPPVGEFITVDGVQLHYVDRGAGPAVVLLHGNGVMLQDYDLSGVLDLAAKHHRVVAFDRPGFGYSDRPRTTLWTAAAQARLISHALEQLGVNSAIVVGHSWGTLVALNMALDDVRRVQGLVLVSGYYYGSARPDVVPSSIPAIPVAGDIIASTTAPLTGLLVGPLGAKASFAPAPISDKFAGFPKALTLRPSQLRATAADTAMMIPSAMAISDRYGELQLPVVIIAGEGDLIVQPSKHAERLAGDIVHSDLIMVPEQGHLLHYAVPERVVTAIDAVQRRAAA